ncbi:MAG: hypothetical protein IJX44_08755 [Bacteroidaceae bacterium]|nr:hypothetical protein [Bacteroidaceae bacterium]
MCEAYSQITLAKRTITSSAENLRQNSNSYNAGVISLCDLSDAETLHTQSLNNLTSAKASATGLIRAFVFTSSDDDFASSDDIDAFLWVENLLA